MLHTSFLCVSNIEEDVFAYWNPQKASNILKPELQEVAKEEFAGSMAPVPRRQRLLVRFLLGEDMSALHY